MKNNVICMQEKRIDSIEVEIASNKQILIDIKEGLERLEDNQRSFFKWLITILGSIILSMIL